MEELYIVEQGCYIKKRGQQFLIYKNNIKLLEISMFKVDNIIIFGNQQISTQAINAAIENNIDIIFLNRNGQFKGKLSGKLTKNVYLRLIQYDILKDNYKKINIAKIIVKGKIKNQILFLKRHNIVTEELNSLIKKIDAALDINSLMGIEGAASKEYFSQFKNILPQEFCFNGRNRRPPRDEINALLSLTYMMTLRKIITEIESSGLDSYIGFLHSIKYGRESLALDILEEFRQSFCDPFTVKLFNRKEIRKEHFINNEDEVYLNEAAFRLYLNKFNLESEKLNKNIKQQIELFKKHLLEEKEYVPIKFKW